MKCGRMALLALLIASLIALAACQNQPGPGIVGRWRTWDGGFYIVFAADGKVTYELDLTAEDIWTIIDGTYRVIGDDSISIDIDHEQSGEYQYVIEEDTLQLTSASGSRVTFRRVKQTP